jgi:hypothetical protein
MNSTSMLLLLIGLTGCSTEEPCESACNGLDGCGDTEDVARCIDECQLSVDSGGKDGQTDCGQIFANVGTCIDDNSCEDYESACSDELSQVSRCQ